LGKEIKRGARGKEVKEIQEWLRFHNLHLEIDNKFGSVTEKMVKKFQVQNELPETGIVDDDTWSILIYPMTAACHPIDNLNSFRNAVLLYAWQHLTAGACEIGGNNKGPWVRLYSDGKDGENVLWCCWFVTFIIREVCKQMNITMPVKRTGGCDSLMKDAIKNNRLILAKDVQPGDLFLIRKSRKDWTHIGFVNFINVEEDWFEALEGNSYVFGRRDGDGVVKKTRAITDKIDFVRID